MSEQDSLDDAIRAEFQKMNEPEEVDEVEVDEAEPEVDETEIEAEPAEDFEPLEPPPKWDRRYKEVFAELAQLPEKGRTYAEAMRDLWKEQQAYATKVEQERAEFQKRVSSWDEVLNPYQNQFVEAGVTPQQVVRQMLGLTTQLNRDPKGTIQRLAERAGIDLANLNQDAPYVPPELRQAQTELQQVRQQLQEMQRAQQQSQYGSALQQIESFRSAKDESGNLLRPHFDKVKDLMTLKIQRREASNLDEAYQQVCESLGLDQQKQANAQVDETARRAALAKKAKDAAKKPVTRAGKRDAEESESFEDDLRKQYRKMAKAS